MVLLALLAHDVGDLCAVPVGGGRVPVMHVVLQGEGAHWIAVLLRAVGVAYLGRGGRGLGLRYAGRNGLSIALFVAEVIKSLRSLVQAQGQVLRFAEIVQVDVVVTGKRPVDAMARVWVAIITYL